MAKNDPPTCLAAAVRVSRSSTAMPAVQQYSAVQCSTSVVRVTKIAVRAGPELLVCDVLKQANRNHALASCTG